ncbi:hypothetical protein [Aurantiacibacter sp. D1-12]|uniref:hypothetical protein n=1 Tax=Aurantiacibacter sp. D1-12 TaxID=2993658 RepID=UPI00237CEE6A|nr:hypothetical protein [Aurantiacibacter sp. D1-12]MDE1467275.1 hypothetical protein [Aurantiacibacter sp. D1-12]
MGLAKQAMLGVAGAFAALALTPQAAEAGTVVASSGPSSETYPVGAQIGDTQRITLRAGDTLTVLSNGRTRTLRGPGTFILAQRGARSDNRALSALTSRRSSSRARTGAVRGDGNAVVSNPNLWYVDVAQSGTICLANPDPIQLWRADTEAAASYSFSRSGAEGEAIDVAFPESEMLGIWDGAVQLREGETYVISGGGSSAEVSFVFLQEIPNDGEELALTLIENGCSVQLDQLTRALAE